MWKHHLMTSPIEYVLFLSTCLTVRLTFLIFTMAVHAYTSSVVQSQSAPLLVLQEPIGNIAATVGMATGPIAGAWEFSCAAFCHTRFRVQCLAQLLSIATSSMATSCQAQVAEWVCLSLEETEEGKVLGGMEQNYHLGTANAEDGSWQDWKELVKLLCYCATVNLSTFCLAWSAILSFAGF